MTSSLFFYSIPARQIGDLANKSRHSGTWIISFPDSGFTHQASDAEPLPGIHAEFSGPIGAPVEFMLLGIRFEKKERNKEKLSFKSCSTLAPAS